MFNQSAIKGTADEDAYDGGFLDEKSKDLSSKSEKKEKRSSSEVHS